MRFQLKPVVLVLMLMSMLSACGDAGLERRYNELERRYEALQRSVESKSEANASLQGTIKSLERQISMMQEDFIISVSIALVVVLLVAGSMRFWVHFSKKKKLLVEKQLKEVELQRLAEEKEIAIERGKEMEVKRIEAEASRLRSEKEHQEAERLKLEEEQKLENQRKESAHQAHLEEMKRLEKQKEVEAENKLLKQKEIEKQQLAHEQEMQRLEEETKRKEIERQTKLNDFPIEFHLDTFMQKLTQLKDQEMKGVLHDKYVQVYKSMNTTFESIGLIPPDKLLNVQQDVHRLNQVEIIMDLYDEKMRRVKKDTVLEEDERTEKIEYWRRLRDRDIAELEQ